MHDPVYAVSGPGTAGRPDQAWRRHVRRHAPEPPASPPFARQRVQNVYHHLADLSWPYDLWNEDAEIAAIAHLLGRHREDVAARIYVDTVHAYNAFNRRFEPAVRAFSEKEGQAKVRCIATIRDQLPAGSSDATVYAAARRACEKEQGHEHPPVAI